MPDMPWKQAERQSARLFGSERRPLSGATHGQHQTGNDDAEHERLYIETKQTGDSKSPYNAICKLMNETVARAELEGKIPVVAIRRTGMKDTDVYLMVKSSDLPALAREFNPKPTPTKARVVTHEVDCQCQECVSASVRGSRK